MTLKTRFNSGYQNLIYQPNFLSLQDRIEILKYLTVVYPIWEMRYSISNPPPSGKENRQLLRPVYWLGNWQFACLNYYHPPQGIKNRCIRAEAYPDVLQKIVTGIESLVRSNFSPNDVPEHWHLNTCLINYYGDHKDPDGRVTDCARVGEHKDFEPGPVASVSIGERALFQFVKSSGKGEKSQVILQQWLEDRSLQIFGGKKFKSQLFHRVQRVESKGQIFNLVNTGSFFTRRINFTFRFVPNEHIQSLKNIPLPQREDVIEYAQTLALRSPYWKGEL